MYRCFKASPVQICHCQACPAHYSNGSGHKSGIRAKPTVKSIVLCHMPDSGAACSCQCLTVYEPGIKNQTLIVWKTVMDFDLFIVKGEKLHGSGFS